MAGYNEILIGRWNRFIQKLTGIKGAAPVPTLSGDVQVMHPLFHGVENRYLEGWDAFGTIPVVSAGVGVNSAVRLRNPPGSNVIAVVFKINLITGAADTVLIENTSTTADLSSTFIVQRLDARGRGSPTCIASSQNNLGAPAQLAIGFKQIGSVDSDFIVTKEQEIPLLPGDAVQFRTVSLNESLRVGLMWRERYLEESERA